MQEVINNISRSVINGLAKVFNMDPAAFIVKFVQVEDQEDLNRLLEILITE